MNSASSQTAWLLAARAGDRLALQQLLVARSASLASYIERRLFANSTPASEVEDICQQTLVDICRDLICFRGENLEQFEAWARKIAERNIYDAARKRTRIQRSGQHLQRQEVNAASAHSLIDILELQPALISTPSSCVQREEVVDQVRLSIQNLPEEYQLAVELRYLQGLSLDVVAERMARGPRAVQGILDRARKLLRSQLEHCQN